MADELEWRPITGLPDYAIREDGLIKRVTANRQNKYKGLIMKGALSKGGYKVAYLTRPSGGQAKPFPVHRLVLTTFVSDPPDRDSCGCHNDGDKLNNHYTNLRWDTQAGNIADKKKHGTLVCGEGHHQALLTEVQAREIALRLKSYKRGMLTALAKEFGVGVTTVSAIRSGTNWRFVLGG